MDEFEIVFSIKKEADHAYKVHGNIEHATNLNAIILMNELTALKEEFERKIYLLVYESNLSTIEEMEAYVKSLNVSDLGEPFEDIGLGDLYKTR